MILCCDRLVILYSDTSTLVRVDYRCSRRNFRISRVHDRNKERIPVLRTVLLLVLANDNVWSNQKILQSFFLFMAKCYAMHGTVRYE